MAYSEVYVVVSELSPPLQKPLEQMSKSTSSALVRVGGGGGDVG